MKNAFENCPKRVNFFKFIYYYYLKSCILTTIYYMKFSEISITQARNLENQQTYSANMHIHN